MGPSPVHGKLIPLYTLRVSLVLSNKSTPPPSEGGIPGDMGISAACRIASSSRLVLAAALLPLSPGSALQSALRSDELT